MFGRCNGRQFLNITWANQDFWNVRLVGWASKPDDSIDRAKFSIVNAVELLVDNISEVRRGPMFAGHAPIDDESISSHDYVAIPQGWIIDLVSWRLWQRRNNRPRSPQTIATLDRGADKCGAVLTAALKAGEPIGSLSRL